MWTVLSMGCAERSPARPDAAPFVCEAPPASEAICAHACPGAIRQDGGVGDAGHLHPDAGNPALVPPEERRAGCLPPAYTGAFGALDAPATVDEYIAVARSFGGSTPEIADSPALKFVIMDAGSSDPWVYLLDPAVYGPHHAFTMAIGCDSLAERRQVQGTLFYRPPNGGAGSFFFETGGVEGYESAAAVHAALTAEVPALAGPLDYLPLTQRELDNIANNPELYDAAPFDIVETGALPSFRILNHGAAFGRLVVGAPGTVPGFQDIVLYETLPNELPLVAGILTSAPQTPLSHVNLRAIQSGIPNVYLEGALVDPSIAPLIGQFVYYEVSGLGFELRSASQSEIDEYFGALRPAETQFPPRDLSVRQITALSDIGFHHAAAFGAKAANLGEMLGFGFPEGTVPDGVAVPFYFYDEFMKHNGFYSDVDELVRAAASTGDRNERSALLSEFRERIRGGAMPDRLMDALQEAQDHFPEGTAIRCRSSTNNEDLPGHSGAGLYESYTHHPHEGHLSKSVKQVFASMWTLRAFEHRDFYRIDHRAAAMAVLMHPNYEDERVNGVALSHDLLYGYGSAAFTVNSVVGEDLVTNPTAAVIPEEMVVAQVPLVFGGVTFTHFVQRHYQDDADSGPLLSIEQILELRDRLALIVSRFAALYEPAPGEPFAMEIEFKITAEDILVIKQARPWVFHAPAHWSPQACDCRCGASR